jgi:hypothetical protein
MLFITHMLTWHTFFRVSVPLMYCAGLRDVAELSFQQRHPS